MLTLGRDGPGRLLSGGLCRQLTQPANPNPGPNPPQAQVLTSPAPIRAAAGPAWTGARGAGAALAPSSGRMAAETPGRAAEAGPGADLDGHCARARRLRRGGHQMGGSRALGGSGPAFSAPQAAGPRGPEGDIQAIQPPPLAQALWAPLYPVLKGRPGASLVAQWLRICLLMQGMQVRALVWEDPTCRGATRPVSHNY
ncbi:hypothetical protein J1605_006457 [Eschrichtius robustus]|uniref:Uncharacterized protein n=1 Tax=Eschrichtius robustus TaxID=9764 RepID=A0AB34H478_ESCRO|nr:hypothetical protein J1605_006457 [Eschrichtius robustus]